jgi:glycosyltransferase involved in cell wall biosynthesis
MLPEVKQRSDIGAHVNPIVSVITIFLNAERFLSEAIESVLAQEFESFELILVDDGSTDGSSTLARKYAKKFPQSITYLEHEHHINRGMSASRNLGISHARGEFITFCDADDAYVPGKLSQQVEVFRSHPELGMVCGAAIYWFSWAGGEDRIVLSGHIQNTPVYPPGVCIAVYPLGQAPAPCNDLLVRRDIVLHVGGFEDHFTGMYEDQAFLVKIYLTAPVYFSSRVTLKYRQHPDSCMARADRTGQYDVARRRFLEWFASYVQALPSPRPNEVEVAVQRALFAYKRPRLHFLLTLPKFILNLPRRAARRLRRTLGLEQSVRL